MYLKNRIRRALEKHDLVDCVPMECIRVRKFTTFAKEKVARILYNNPQRIDRLTWS